MMAEIVWKGFGLGELFSWSSRKDLSLKNYNSYDEYSDGRVEVITGSKNSNNNVFYEINDLPANYPIYENCLVLNTNGSIGHCFYYSDRIISPTSSVHILLHKNKKLENIMTPVLNLFFASQITKIFTSDLFGYSFLIDNNKFNREIILLPCLEVSSGEDFIWDDNGKHYTLAVDYIEKLMDSAKEEKEKKTIKLYKAEREKYEAEREKYEEGYIEEKPNVVWKDFKLSDIFIYKTGRDSSIAQKNLSMSKTMDLDYNVAIVTETTENNGIGFYMRDDDPILLGKIVNQGLTFGTQFGNCNFHSRPFFIIGNTNYLIEKSIKLYNIFADNSYIGLFFSSILTYIFRKSNLFGFGNKIDHDAFYREIILLPCLEVSSDEDFIWEGNGKYYNLAVNYIAYIYLTGKINYNNKLIDSYSYLY